MELSQTDQITEMEPHKIHTPSIGPMLSVEQKELSHLGLSQLREAYGESCLTGPST